MATTRPPKRLVVPDEPTPPAKDRTPRQPVKLPIRRGVFGLRLWPDSVLLATVFLGSLLLLWWLTQSREPTPGTTLQTTGAEQTAPNVATEITVTTPTPGALFRSGDPVSGTAQVYGGSLYYRLKDSSGAVILSNVTQTKDAAKKSAFETHLNFTTTSRTGSLEVYGFDAAGGEAGKQVLSLRFR